jgi:hypothetical protein
MPIYEFKNNETDEVTEVTMRISEYDDFLESNPHLTRYYSGVPSLVTGSTSALRTAGDGWKDHLNRIKSGSGRSNTIKT